ncbi:EboA domain-containing protein [Agromyces sp. NPDC058136]|uniref:EboA domain-containing protein n=1 Tax=Agromyces sp. NPDC058136 TaxID=3346354 RepID=UPI0036DB409D
MTHPWTSTAVAEVTADPGRITALFPMAGRKVGRDPVAPDADPLGLVHGTADDRAREELVLALVTALPPGDAARALAELYHWGDDAEQRGVLVGLNAAAVASEAGATGAADRPTELPAPIVSTGRELVAEALRTNDPRLVAAALGAFAAAHLDQHTWRHGVLKALFMGIPLTAVADLEARSDAETSRMAAALIAERRAAGRTIGDDMTMLAALHPETGA